MEHLSKRFKKIKVQDEVIKKNSNKIIHVEQTKDGIVREDKFIEAVVSKLDALIEGKKLFQASTAKKDVIESTLEAIYTNLPFDIDMSNDVSALHYPNVFLFCVTWVLISDSKDEISASYKQKIRDIWKAALTNNTIYEMDTKIRLSSAIRQGASVLHDVLNKEISGGLLHSHADFEALYKVYCLCSKMCFIVELDTQSNRDKLWEFKVEIYQLLNSIKDKYWRSVIEEALDRY
uniref:Uncharacterized protein n=1 Tax=Ceratitis capitata TaxID=7213 RepID=W8CB62_CERCA